MRRVRKRGRILEDMVPGAKGRDLERAKIWAVRDVVQRQSYDFGVLSDASQSAHDERGRGGLGREVADVSLFDELLAHASS